MFDSHAHVSFSQFDVDRDDVISHARENGVSGWLEVGTNLEQSKAAVQLAEQHEDVYATVGVHPSDIASLTDSSWMEIEHLVDHPKVKAIGEVGFDFYRGGDMEEQQNVVERFIQIARTRDLPLVFHVRSSEELDAHDALLYLLSRQDPSQRPSGVIHTFSGTADQARRYLEFGMYVSFSGVITFPNAGPIIDAARWAPLDRILIETDCPFLSPAPYRGKRNEPAMVRFVAEKLAELKKASVSEIGDSTEQNAHRLFRLNA